MNIRGQFKFWLVATLTTSTITTTCAFQSAFHNKKGHENVSPSSKPLDMTTATLDPSLLQNEIDISDVLAQAEAALQTAQEAIPSSKSINKEMKKFIEMKNDMAKFSLNLLDPEAMNFGAAAANAGSSGSIGGVDISSMSEKDQVLATAFIGSAFGVVAGSPLVLGAALGVAGTHLLEGEKGAQTRKILALVSKKVSRQMQEAVAHAHAQIEKEEDLSKVPEKMMLAFQEKIQRDLQEAKETPKQLIDNLKGTLESENFKAAPGRALNAFKAFMSSDELKLAQKKAMQAIKDGLDSEEMKALKSRAALVLEETAGKSKNE